MNHMCLKTILLSTKTLSFSAKSKLSTGWNGNGVATVNVKKENGYIVFAERGYWETHLKQKFDFNNIYRWTVDGEAVKLEHLRFGAGNPVFLFELQRVSENHWQSVTAHKCNLDFYSADLIILENKFDFIWKINGPKKNEVIHYCYYQK